MKRFIVLFFIVILTTCCSDGDEYYYELVPIESSNFPEFFEYGYVYEVSVQYKVSNDCFLYPDLIYEYDQDARNVAIVGTFVDENSCSPEDALFNYVFRVHAIQTEDYIFRLWQGEDENGDSIYEEVIVPVVNVNNKVEHGFKETHT